MWAYRAKLDRLVDADTCSVAIDAGFSITVTELVRLAGIDAPEMRTPEGKAARAYALQWFATHGSGAGPWPLTIVTRKANPRDRWGRYIATITAQGDTLNADLLAAGHATPWPRP